MNVWTGIWPLIKLILRRDRFILPMRVLWLSILPISGVATFSELYPTQELRDAFAQLTNTTPALTALLGKLYGSSIGALVAWRFSIAAVFAALASLLTVIRHTRTEEEAGRRELLGSAVVGRHAPLSAALIVTFAADLVFAGLIAGGLALQGLDLEGSLATGISYGAAALAFAAIGAVAAQISQSAGSARGIASTILGLSFLLRAIGTASDYEWLSWLSPLGWATFMRPFGGEEWWILLLFAGLVVVFIGTAYLLSSKRDVGAGFLEPGLGPEEASSRFRSSFSLALRLQKSLLLGWLTGLGIYGLFMGGIIDSIKGMLNDNPQLEAFFAQVGGEAGIADQTLAVFAGIIGMGAAAYSIQSSLRMRNEEASLRADPILATAVGRLRWSASHLIFAYLGPVLVLAVTGIIIGAVYGALTDNIGEEIGRLLSATVIQLPAVWIFTGFTVMLFGLLPRFTAATWAALATFFLLSFLGEILKLPEWILDTSPFRHVPRLPAEEFSITPVAWLMAIAVVFTVVGLYGFKQRDIGK